MSGGQTPMKIALVNKYLYPKGGADISNLEMARLLKQRGHEVVLMGMEPAEGAAGDFPAYLVSQVDYDARLNLRQKLRLAARLLYSLEAHSKMRELIGNEQPDIIHFNNIYHQLSPSVIDAAAARNVPTVMTLRDYKVTCSTYYHFREGEPCEECRDGRFWNGVRFRCTDGSLARSVLNALEMYLHHNILKTYGKVDVFISASQFLKRKVTELGFRGRIVHLPNFVQMQDFQPRYDWDAREVVYFGRLSPEKGLATLLEAVKGLDIQLRIIGAGPMEDELRRRVSAGAMQNVQFAGFLSGEELRCAVARCMFTVIPSELYEVFGRTVAESFALGKPVIGSDMGGIPELVAEGRGVRFRAGDALDLRERIGALANDPDAIRTMGRNARRYAESHLNPDVFYDKLMDIYRSLL